MGAAERAMLHLAQARILPNSAAPRPLLRWLLTVIYALFPFQLLSNCTWRRRTTSSWPRAGTHQGCTACWRTPMRSCGLWWAPIALLLLKTCGTAVLGHDDVGITRQPFAAGCAPPGLRVCQQGRRLAGCQRAQRLAGPPGGQHSTGLPHPASLGLCWSEEPTHCQLAPCRLHVVPSAEHTDC